MADKPGAVLVVDDEPEMRACAGEPKKRSSSGEETRLTYHRRAPVFEESFATSKTSMPCPRHACKAVVVLKGDRYRKFNTIPRRARSAGASIARRFFAHACHERCGR